MSDKSRPQNPPAFARSGIVTEGDERRTVDDQGGMTLRDFFAAAALTGIAAVRNYAFDVQDEGELDYRDAAEDAYAYAEKC
jgi:hypothetical protein